MHAPCPATLAPKKPSYGGFIHPRLQTVQVQVQILQAWRSRLFSDSQIVSGASVVRRQRPCWLLQRFFVIVCNSATGAKRSLINDRNSSAGSSIEDSAGMVVIHGSAEA
ncbi:hypothetical protein BS78_10G076100 [Paspalum vaginatum]|nr:hypothetical protein BS78_10G076100 [Paspalum vaginatum]